MKTTLPPTRGEIAARMPVNVTVRRGTESHVVSGVDVPRIEDGLEGIVRWAWGAVQLNGLNDQPDEIIISYGRSLPVVVHIYAEDPRRAMDALQAEIAERDATLSHELEEE